jgi:succinyl-diaminopimelate desuccinylase
MKRYLNNYLKNKMTRTLELTKNLIARKSNTPDDAGCQDLLISLLEPLGFKCEKIKSGDVDNLYARKGTEAPFFVFAGHTDVVPSGPR